MNNKLIYNFLRKIKTFLFIRSNRLNSNIPLSTYFNQPLLISKNIICGEYCYFGPGTWVCPNVTIGNYVMMAPYSRILGKDHQFREFGKPIIFSGRGHTPTTSIGSDVWIGMGATIMAGCSVGDGSIVASDSIVLSDVEPNSVYGGTPANKLFDRFSSTEIFLDHMRIISKVNNINSDFCS